MLGNRFSAFNHLCAVGHRYSRQSNNKLIHIMFLKLTVRANVSDWSEKFSHSIFLSFFFVGSCVGQICHWTTEKKCCFKIAHTGYLPLSMSQQTSATTVDVFCICFAVWFDYLLHRGPVMSHVIPQVASSVRRVACFIWQRPSVP